MPSCLVLLTFLLPYFLSQWWTTHSHDTHVSVRFKQLVVLFYKMLHFCPHCVRLHFIVENIQFRSKARACQPLQRYRTRNAHRQHDRWEKIATTLNDQILQFSTPKSAPCLQFPCTEGNVRVDCFSLISLTPLLLLFTLSFVLVISTVPCLGWHGGVPRFTIIAV